MKLYILPILSLVVLLGACNSGENSIPLSEPVLGAIQSKDQWMVDDSGRVLMIHGVNQVNKMPPYDHVSLGFDETDAAFLQDYGFNAVRLGVI